MCVCYVWQLRNQKKRRTKASTNIQVGQVLQNLFLIYFDIIYTHTHTYIYGYSYSFLKCLNSKNYFCIIGFSKEKKNNRRRNSLHGVNHHSKSSRARHKGALKVAWPSSELLEVVVATPNASSWGHQPPKAWVVTMKNIFSLQEIKIKCFLREQLFLSFLSDYSYK